MIVTNAYLDDGVDVAVVLGGDGVGDGAVVDMGPKAEVPEGDVDLLASLGRQQPGG